MVQNLNFVDREFQDNIYYYGMKYVFKMSNDLIIMDKRFLFSKTIVL